MVMLQQSLHDGHNVSSVLMSYLPVQSTLDGFLLKMGHSDSNTKCNISSQAGFQPGNSFHYIVES